MSKIKFLVSTLLTFGMVAAANAAEAAVDTDIQGIVTDASTLWGTVKTLIVGIVAVMIGLWVVKKIRGR